MIVSAKKILLLYITVLSGHHRAAIAIEKAIKFISPQTDVYTINCFHYTNPILEKIITHTYSSIIKRTPEVWEYLYDNPNVLKNTQRFKESVHRYNSSKMKNLIEEFNPDTVICTQAFPCGMVADLKNDFAPNLNLIGVQTDFYPHSYWLYEAVDKYIVPSEEAKQMLIENGIRPEKIFPIGIPVDISFKEEVDKNSVQKEFGFSPDKITLLIMGGSKGFGPIKDIVLSLDQIKADIQMIVITGTNNRVYSYLKRRRDRFNKKLILIDYTDNINKYMSISDIIITKPGGLTVSEALAKRLPLVIIKPLPGQENKNTQFLMQKKAALKANNKEELGILIEKLCNMPSKLEFMRQQAALLAKPDAAIDIAKMVLEL